VRRPPRLRPRDREGDRGGGAGGDRCSSSARTLLVYRLIVCASSQSRPWRARCPTSTLLTWRCRRLLNTAPPRCRIVAGSASDNTRGEVRDGRSTDTMVEVSLPDPSRAAVAARRQQQAAGQAGAPNKRVRRQSGGGLPPWRAGQKGAGTRFSCGISQA
jgi:hypothetical protein